MACSPTASPIAASHSATTTLSAEPPAPPPPVASAPSASAAAPPAEVEPPPRPFSLPEVKGAGEAKPSVEPANPYLERVHYKDCEAPKPVSGWAAADRSWFVHAYRCKYPIPERPTPDPLLSDGWFFLWASRGTLVLEAHGRQGSARGPKRWRAYLAQAISSEEPMKDAEAAPAAGSARFDAQAMSRFLAKLERLARSPRGGRCDDRRAAYEALGKELDGFFPDAPGVLENAMKEASECDACNRGAPCAMAVAAVERAAAWARTQKR